MNDFIDTKINKVATLLSVMSNIWTNKVYKDRKGFARTKKLRQYCFVFSILGTGIKYLYTHTTYSISSSVKFEIHVTA